MSTSAAAQRRLVVVGGGITGLAAAHRLLERAPAGSWQVVLLEAGPRLGGVIATERRDDFLLEGGPDSFITEKPEAIELCRRLGLEDQLLPTNDQFRRTLIVRRGRLVPLPDGFQLLGPTRILPFLLSPVLSLRGKLTAAKDLLLPRGGPRWAATRAWRASSGAGSAARCSTGWHSLWSAASTPPIRKPCRSRRRCRASSSSSDRSAA